MLQTQLEKFIKDTQHPEKNFDVGYEYEHIGQYASAIGYYLSCADKTNSDKLAYECLLRIAKCYFGQGDRNAHEENSLLMAVELLPKRVEAYHSLANFYERTSDMKKCLVYAKLGLELGNDIVSQEVIEPLYTDVGYKGLYQLKFEQGVGLWWVGRFNESRAVFLELLEDPTVCEEYIGMVEYNLANVLVQEKLDIVLQGPYDSYALDTAHQYITLPFVNNVIISCWENDDVPKIKHSGIKVVQSPEPDNRGTGNRNLQIVSSLAGVKRSTAQYVCKMRNDQRYTLDSMWKMNEVFNKNFDKKIPKGAKGRIFTAGYFKEFPFHPRDHLFWGHRQDLIDLFSTPLEPIGLHEKLNMEKVELSHLYDCFIRNESYIGAHYCARFNSKIKKYLLMPERYLYDGAPFMKEVMDVSNDILDKVFQCFPREGIDLAWPTYGWEHYPYENQATEFGESWCDE